MSGDFLLVPVAIREGINAQLRFPVDITYAEADKIARVILAYAVDGPPRDVVDQAIAADVARGLSLRECARKHGVGIGRVRGAISRAHPEQAKMEIEREGR